MKTTGDLPLVLCLPHEILVRIIKDVQWPPRFYSRARIRPISLVPPTILGHCTYNFEWYTIMLVCSHLRIVMLCSPELWSFADTRWPLSTINLHVSRARSHPLQVLAHVDDSTSSLLTTRLLQHARDAEITFSGPIDDGISLSMWLSLCHRVLKTTTKLRVLTIDVQPKEEWTFSLDIRLAFPIMGGECSTLTHLSLQGISLIDPPDLSNLVYLRLADVFPLPHSPTWLQRWIGAAPNLRSLGLSVYNMTPSEIAAPAAPALLLHLAQLSVLAHLDTVALLLASIHVPSESLLMFVHFEPGDGVEAEAAGVEAIHAYTRLFWEHAAAGAAFPKANLDVQLRTANQPYFSLLLQDGDPDRFRIYVTYDDVQATGPFLGDVVWCTVDAPTLGDIDWVHLQPLDALNSLRICTSVRVTLANAKGIQEWVDERARAGHVVRLIEIIQRPPDRVLEHILVEWRPAECALAEAQWTTEGTD
jgi:hypothetical protein